MSSIADADSITHIATRFAPRPGSRRVRKPMHWLTKCKRLADHNRHRHRITGSVRKSHLGTGPQRHRCDRGHIGTARSADLGRCGRGRRRRSPRSSPSSFGPRPGSSTGAVVSSMNRRSAARAAGGRGVHACDGREAAECAAARDDQSACGYRARSKLSARCGFGKLSGGRVRIDTSPPHRKRSFGERAINCVRGLADAPKPDPTPSRTI